MGLAAAGFGVVMTVTDGAPAAAGLSSSTPTTATSTTATSTSPTATPQTTDSVASAPSSGATPLRLRVPALGIEARVLPVPVTDGTLVPPADPQELGWWRDGAGIGAIRGAALITGHTVHTGGGAMDHLADLEVGAEVTVETRAGETAYRVVSVTYYPKQTLADHAVEVFAQTGPHRLVLITCDQWNGSAYDGNTVAVAQPIAQPIAQPTAR